MTVTGSNSVGSAGASSDPSATVAAAPPANTVPPTLSVTSIPQARSEAATRAAVRVS